MRYLLDTNTITALSHRNEVAWANLNQLADDDGLYTCFIVVGEWEYGLRNTSKKQRLEIEMNSRPIFDTLSDIWESTYEISCQYGAFQADLRSRGQMIPTNDIWIGATAAVHEATIVTSDAHFSRLADLNVVSWT